MAGAIEKASAYGGVLLKADGQILLREPSRHYDGYVWTFAKGRPEPEDTPDMTALREVREETGYHAEIIDVLPGLFHGGTTTNAYFIMRALEPQGALDNETWATCWVTFQEAEQLIGQTKNTIGRQRDLAVLAAARAWFEQHGAACFESAMLTKEVVQGEPVTKALALAAEQHYLGSPDVVQALMASWFDVVIDCLAQTATAEQRHARMVELVRIMTEDGTGYTRLPGWHTEGALGKALITACNLDAEYDQGENLALIVSEALTAIDSAVRELAYYTVDARDGAEQFQQRTGELLSFAVAVFFGTHELLFPGKTLVSFKPPAAAS